jgi:hypothetical protein
MWDVSEKARVSAHHASRLIDRNSELCGPSHTLRVLEADEAHHLEALLSVLDFDGRRNRFGAAICDLSLRSFCRRANRATAIVIGAFRSRRMEAAIELFPLSPHWESAELELTCFPVWREDLALQLLAQAIVEASTRGCTGLIAYSPLRNSDLHRLLCLSGAVFVGDLLYLPL